MKATLKTGFMFVWKLFFGALVCQWALTSMLAIGWTFRLAQRAAVKRWWALSSIPGKAARFRDEADGNDLLRPYRNYPNWFKAPGGMKAAEEALDDSSGKPSRFRVIRHGVFGGLWQNAKLGAQGIFNVLALTILPLLLWEFGWYSGWDNSFNKGYEQFSVGIAISWTGILLFLAVMLYLPMAQARQAVTGDWRSFYHFRTVWGLVRRRRVACLILAGLYSLVSLPLVIMRSVIPLAAGNSAEFAEMSSLELLQTANRYFFFVGIAGFIAYAFLRVFAARIYAGALLEAFKKGDLSVAELGALEGPVLNELGHITREERQRRHIAVEIIGKAARPPWRVAMTTATLFVWFTFVAQNYVGEFLKHHDQRGFVNHALVQLPWFRYVPDHLQQAAKEEREGDVQNEGISVAAGN